MPRLKKEEPEKKITPKVTAEVKRKLPVKRDEKEIGTEEIKIEEKVQKTKEKRELTYFEATGRRKTAVARIRLTIGEGNFIINDLSAWDYFKDQVLAHQILEQPFSVVGQSNKFNVLIKVNGGGKMAQMGAVVHGISRALDKYNHDFKKALKKEGLITRDSRMKERKKFGLLGARTRKPSPKR